MDQPIYKQILNKHFFIPMEHGAWIWLLGPLFIGAAAGGKPDGDLILLIFCALIAFLIRQPVTLIVKVNAGRRARRDLLPALVWITVYTVLGSLGVWKLAQAGYGQLLWLAVPGIPIFAFYLWLIWRRKERRQWQLELIGAGALALTAPAAYWISGGVSDDVAWTLFLLTWLQSAASIVHVYIRLEQRILKESHSLGWHFNKALPSLGFHAFNLAVSGVLVAFAMVNWWVLGAFLLMLFCSLAGVIRPACGYRPSKIGIQQLVASLAFVLIMMLAYLLG